MTTPTNYAEDGSPIDRALAATDPEVRLLLLGEALTELLEAPRSEPRQVLANVVAGELFYTARAPQNPEARLLILGELINEAVHKPMTVRNRVHIAALAESLGGATHWDLDFETAYLCDMSADPANA